MCISFPTTSCTAAPFISVSIGIPLTADAPVVFLTGPRCPLILWFATEIPLLEASLLPPVGHVSERERDSPLRVFYRAQVQLAEALLRTPCGPVAGLSAQRRLQLCPGGLRHPGGALPVAGAAHRHQAPAM